MHRGHAVQNEELNSNLSIGGNSLSLIFLLFPFLSLKDATSAHDKKQNLVAIHEYGHVFEFLACERRSSQQLNRIFLTVCQALLVIKVVLMNKTYTLCFLCVSFYVSMPLGLPRWG